MKMEEGRKVEENTRRRRRAELAQHPPWKSWKILNGTNLKRLVLVTVLSKTTVKECVLGH